MRQRNSKRPVPVKGTPAAATTWFQEVDDIAFRDTEIFNSDTVVVQKLPRGGITLHAKAGGSGGTTLQLYVITELFGTDADMAYDYFGATPWSYSSNNTSGGQVLVAKCPTGRGPQTELIDGQAIFYSQYYNDNQRYSYNTASQAAEYQAMHTRYTAYPGFPPPTDANGNPLPYQTLPFQWLTIEQCFVLVSQTSGPVLFDSTGTPISYIEVSPRFWAYSPSLNGG